jgi:RsiW-degrading membrane proteinase PrsW (M82 family)
MKEHPNKDHPADPTPIAKRRSRFFGDTSPIGWVALGLLVFLAGLVTEFRHAIVLPSEGLNVRVLLSGILAPAMFWIGYLYFKDRYTPEPAPAILLSYVLGLVAGALCILLYDLSVWLGLPDDPFTLAETDRWAFFLYSLLVIGVVEEVCKFLPFWLVCMRFRKFDEEIDGFIYASAVALGFASYENLLYLPYLEGANLYGRAIASPLTHTIFASIWGYTCARARIAGRPIIWPALGGLLIAAALHGIYDFFATDSVMGAGAALTILVLWLWRICVIRGLHRAHQKRSPMGTQDGDGENQQA